MQTNIKTTDAPPGSLHPVVQRAVALSIRQPWAWLIINAGKDIENRIWPTRFRGRVLIHASKGMTRQEYEEAMNWIVFNARLPLDFHEPQMDELQRGGIIGETEIVDCVTRSTSPWFVGKYGFVMRNTKPLPFRACRGALGFFNPGNDEVSDRRASNPKT